METELADVLFCHSVYLMYIKSKKKERRYWVNPLISDRLITGQFYLKHPELQEFPEKFFDYYKMSKPSFEELLSKLYDRILKQDTNMRSAIPPEEMLALTLRYLASGNSLIDIAEKYCVGRSTAGKIIRHVCVTIWDLMKAECIPIPTKDKWFEIAKGFEARSHFPHCIGAIDGKYIRIVKPYKNGLLLKHSCSIVLLALVDSNYRFIYVDIGTYEEDSDLDILTNSSIWNKLLTRTFEVPNPDSNGVPTSMPYVIVGDEAFGLTNFLLTPYSGKSLNDKRKIFNYRLTLARRYVECTFGIMTNKWRIFHRAIDVSVDFADEIVKACCVLHNFVRDREGYQLEDTLIVTGFEDDLVLGNSVGSRAPVHKIRDKFADFFVSTAGEISWQYAGIGKVQSTNN